MPGLPPLRGGLGEDPRPGHCWTPRSGSLHQARGQFWFDSLSQVWGGAPAEERGEGSWGASQSRGRWKAGRHLREAGGAQAAELSFPGAHA